MDDFFALPQSDFPIITTDPRRNDDRERVDFSPSEQIGKALFEAPAS